MAGDDAIAATNATVQLTGRAVQLGSPDFIAGLGVTVPPVLLEPLAEAALTPVAVAADGRLLGVMGLADPLRASSKAAVARLQAMGLRVVMLTGDNEKTARAIGRQAGVDEEWPSVLRCPGTVLDVLDLAGSNGRGTLNGVGQIRAHDQPGPGLSNG